MKKILALFIASFLLVGCQPQTATESSQPQNTTKSNLQRVNEDKGFVYYKGDASVSGTFQQDGAPFYGLTLNLDLASQDVLPKTHGEQTTAVWMSASNDEFSQLLGEKVVDYIEDCEPLLAKYKGQVRFQIDGFNELKRETSAFSVINVTNVDEVTNVQFMGCESQPLE